MRSILIAFFFVFPQLLLAQHISYEIKGNIKNFKIGENIYLRHHGYDRNYLDSIKLIDGKFSFKGSTDISNEPDENYIQSAAYIYIDHTGTGLDLSISTRPTHFNDMVTVYLEPGITEVTIIDSVYNATIKPPPGNQGHYTLDSIYSALYKKSNKSYQDAKKLYGTSGNLMQYTYKQDEIARVEQKKDIRQFIKTHLSSPVTLYLLKHDEEYYSDYDILEPYFTPLTVTLKNTAFGKDYAARLAILKNTRLGEMAPQFTMNDPNGKPVNLAQFKEKYVLIDFWASWCSPCRQENPAVVKAYDLFKNQNFDILGVSLDEKKDDWLKAIDKDHLTWTQVSDLKEWDNAVGKLYSVQAIPQNFLIDPDGKIIAKNLFGDDLINTLKKIFGPLANLK